MTPSSIVRQLCPPILISLPDAIIGRTRKRRADQNERADQLFDGDDRLFKELVSTADVYAEYGCGASTLWVSRNTECRIFSVDSSSQWVGTVQDNCGRPDLVKLHHADLGPVGDWGRPLSYDKHDNFADYTDWIWKQGVSPSVVLIDGRFRVCCFLTSLLHSREGAAIIFDDYHNMRAHYHFVEKFLKPVDTCGRQALFRVPARASLDEERLKDAIEKFRFVFD
jgi:hypothetical protein